MKITDISDQLFKKQESVLEKEIQQIYTNIHKLLITSVVTTTKEVFAKKIRLKNDNLYVVEIMKAVLFVPVPEYSVVNITVYVVLRKRI